MGSARSTEETECWQWNQAFHVQGLPRIITSRASRPKFSFEEGDTKEQVMLVQISTVLLILWRVEKDTKFADCEGRPRRVLFLFEA